MIDFVWIHFEKSSICSIYIDRNRFKEDDLFTHLKIIINRLGNVLVLCILKCQFLLFIKHIKIPLPVNVDVSSDIRRIIVALVRAFFTIFYTVSNL